MSKRRILYVAPLSGLGGGESSLLNLMCAMLESHSYEPILWLFSEGELGNRARGMGIKVYVQPLTPLLKRVGPLPIFPAADVLRLRRFLVENKISAIHLNGLEGVWAVGVAAKMCRVPVVWTCYGPWQRFKSIRRWVLSWVFDRVIGTTAAIISYLQAEGFVRNRLTLIPLGVDIDRIAEASPCDLRHELGLSPESFLVGVVARFQHVKGQDVFLRAAMLAAREDPTLCFVLTGGTPFGNSADEEYRRSVLAMAVDERLRDRVFFLGERSDIASIMKGLDLLVLPSRSESFGMVLIEAMAAGRPVLATSCEGPQTIIEHGKTGLLISTENPQEMAEAILLLASAEELRRQLGQAGRASVRERYSVRLQAACTEAVYEELLGRGIR